MANGAVNFNLDSADDPVLPDQIPSFDGGQFSNLRANLLQPNQSARLDNCDIDKLGKLRTRRGTTVIGPSPNPQPDPGVTTRIQGLTSYQTSVYNYVVAAHNAKIWKFNGTTWDRIATGGAADNDEIVVFRTGAINQAVTSTALPLGGYLAGTTVLVVDGITGIVGPGEKLYFVTNLKSDYYEYTIAAVNGVTTGIVAPVIGITLEEPGLVFDVADNWGFIVARPAKINHAAYAGNYGPGTPAGFPIVIDDFGKTGTINTGGTINVNEVFVIKSENVTHRATAVSGGPPTTSIDQWENFNPATGGWIPGRLQIDYVGSSTTDPVVFAQGNDVIYFSDGVGSIYGWNGKTVQNLSGSSALDYLTGSAYTLATTSAPTACKILLWFQNRLIASGIAAEPDAIYFSDYFDATKWDHNYQKIRVGGGESDPITGLVAWTDLNLLVFKKNSIYVINLDPAQNPNPDDPTGLVASFAVKQIHKRIGCPAPLSAVQVGGGSTTPGSDVFFVDGDKRVHSIRRVLAAETQQEVGVAVSLPMQDVIDQINVDHIELATGMYHNEHYMLGMPGIRGTGGGTYNNSVVTYNLLTQSWCGSWNWFPTCFSIRTDLGRYSKLIFGDINGKVVQWMDDLSLDEETPTTYQDEVLTAVGTDIRTQILTRAITFGDYFSYKSGLNVELEFDESVADDVDVKVVLDKVTQIEPLAEAFSTLSERALILGTSDTTLPFVLPGSPALLPLAFDLQRYGTWRELQFLITAPSGKLAIRSIRVTGFMDSIQLQSVSSTATPDLS